MSVAPTRSVLSIARPKGWAALLIVIVIVYTPAAQIQDILTSLIALSGVLVSGSAVRAVSARQPQTTA
ncbi:hypothetical protein ACH4HG_25880 [Streptomyces coeruleorubidus]|jgi:hypothetical protein|uniref:Uncharacterized protein n=1 Tax=Streptomyces coeruleorubidus TaxID=116188 RepID=A0A5J6IBM3_STRC4|nr:hypothetical protein CP976_32480 [Streptomyces coeruleorubidus]GGT59900.1 hypothetical protein GCM10010256_16460 [Streptomyces coeruleorubidus]GGU30522.1 hypothetical protein GCM10010244_66090 [Streptomyces bellus]